MGAIAGAMSENGRLAYIADYPLFGTIANINAFALGARMINPRSKVYLEWSTLKDADLGKVMDSIYEKGVSIVSGRDMVIPEDASRYFGLYRLENSTLIILPCLCGTGENFTNSLSVRSWTEHGNTTTAAQRKKPSTTGGEWSAGVVDVICPRIFRSALSVWWDLLKDTIGRGEFNPFSGVLYSQNGVVQEDPGRSLAPEEIIKMNWLAENIIGSIPDTKD